MKAEFLDKWGVAFLGVLFVASAGPLFWAWTLCRHRELTTFITAGYNSSHEWWEIVVLVRRLSIQVLASLAPMSYYSNLHAGGLILIVALAFYFQASRSPYQLRDLNKLEVRTTGASLIALILALLSNFAPAGLEVQFFITIVSLANGILICTLGKLILLFSMAYWNEKNDYMVANTLDPLLDQRRD